MPPGLYVDGHIFYFWLAYDGETEADSGALGCKI